MLVVTWNNEADIGACLTGALRQDDGAQQIDIIVVDNASTDRTVEIVESFGDKVTLLRQPTNLGFAAGMNLAAAAATGDFLLLLNPDCEMDEGCVATLWRALANTPGLGLAAARLRNIDGTPQAFARRWLSPSTVALTLTDTGQRFDRRFLGSRTMHSRRYEDELTALTPASAPLTVDCPAGACVMLWAAHARSRLFDERFPLFFNDAELALRLRHKGYRAEVIPAAGAVHGYGTSHRQLQRARRRAEFVASMRLFVSSTATARFSAFVWTALMVDAALSGLRWLVPVGSSSRRKEAFANLRGVLGGLGLPFGAAPWLTSHAGKKTRLRRVVRRARSLPLATARAALRRLRRLAFLVRLHLAAAASRSRAEVRLHRTVDVPWDVTFEIRPGAHVVVEMGEKAHVQRGFILRLQGHLHVGHHSQLRYGVNLNVKGSLRLEGRNVVGRGATIHADGTQVWGWGASCSEYVTVIDTDHAVDGSVVHILDHPVLAGDVRLDANAWLGAHATVLPGVTIGAGSVVGANGVVSRDVPAGVVAVGAPAVAVRELPNAWHLLEPQLDPEGQPARRLDRIAAIGTGDAFAS